MLTFQGKVTVTEPWVSLQHNMKLTGQEEIFTSTSKIKKKKKGGGGRLEHQMTFLKQ